MPCGSGTARSPARCSFCLSPFSDRSILGYFKASNYTSAYDSFLSLLHSTAPNFPLPDASHSDLLEKKWTSIIRMNKRIMDLEAQNQQLKEDLEQAGKGKKVDQSAVLPREPAKHVLRGHRDGVRACKFHPVYSLLATASEDATIKVWDSESGKLERTLQGHQDAVFDIDFNASGSALASCSADLSVKLWSFENTDEVVCSKTLQGHDHSVSSVGWLPSGDFLLSASRDKSIKLWEVATGYCVRTFSGHDQWVRAVAVHPSGALFVSASMDQSIKLWVVKTGEMQRTLRDHDHVVECVAFSNHLADLTLNAARAAEAKENGTVVPAHIVNGTAAASGAAAASSSSSSSSYSNPILAAAAAAASAASSSSAAAAAAAAPVPLGGMYLASGSRDRTVRVWDTTTGTCVATLTGHDNWVSSVLWHPSGKFLLTGSDDKSIRVWDLSRGFKCVKKLAESHESFVKCLAWSQNHAMLASGGVDNVAKIWECR